MTEKRKRPSGWTANASGDYYTSPARKNGVVSMCAWCGYRRLGHWYADTFIHSKFCRMNQQEEAKQ